VWAVAIGPGELVDGDCLSDAMSAKFWTADEIGRCA